MTNAIRRSPSGAARAANGSITTNSPRKRVIFVMRPRVIASPPSQSDLTSSIPTASRVIGSATSSAYHQLGTVASEWRISDDAKYSHSARQVDAANLATVARVDWPNGSHDARLAGDEYLPLAL